MTKEARQAARERERKATPGPWTGDRFDGTVKYFVLGAGQRGCITDYDAPGDCVLSVNHRTDGFPREEDAEFVLAARTDLPAALDALDEAEDQLKLYGADAYPVTPCPNCDGSGTDERGSGCCRIPGHARVCECLICKWKTASYQAEARIAELEAKVDAWKAEADLWRGHFDRVGEASIASADRANAMAKLQGERIAKQDAENARLRARIVELIERKLENEEEIKQLRAALEQIQSATATIGIEFGDSEVNRIAREALKGAK